MKQEETTEKEEVNHRQVKQVKNSKLLSFADEDEEDEVLPSRIVSFQESQGVVKKEDLKPAVIDEKERVKKEEERVKKEKESAWVKKMKEKIMAKMENADVPVDTPVREEKEEEKSVEETMKEKVKEKIREMKKKSKEVEMRERIDE